MPNDNHETYQGNDICTYTDTIDADNTFTVEEIEACVLSAGVVPFDDPRILPLGEYSQGDCTGTNIYSPFYKETDPSMILWIDDSAMVQAENTNHYWYKHIVYVSVNQLSNFIATDLTIDKYKNFLTVETYQQTVDGQTYTLYAPSIETKYGSENDWNTSVLAPMFLLTAGGTVAVSQKLNTLMPICSWAWAWGEGTLTNSLDIIGSGIGDQRNLMDGTAVSLGDCIWEALDEEPYAISEGVPDATFPRVHVGDHFTHIYLGGNPLSLRYGYNNIDDILLECAFCGLKFEYNGTTYKPLAENGVVYGYTDDMTVTSEWDEWVHIGDHDIPVTPPAPPTPPINPWDVDPENYGWSGGEVSGMVKYYLLTAGQMSSLQTAIASNANWTIDYLNCIVSCFVVPNSGIFFDAPIPTTVKFKLDNATEWDTGVGCARIQGTKNKSGGTIEIPRLTNTFYDFEPYSDYSVYIPFCGRVPIKGNVCLGHEIKVTYYPDVPTCSLTAVVSCGGATIAIAKGSFGTMTPVTSNGSDRKTAAVIGDVAPIITGIGTGIVGVALGNPLIVGAGAAQALGGIMGGVKETVQSYAYSVGSTGDSSFFSAGNRCYYYANYPLIDEVVNNSMFGHSVGYLCNTVGKLSGFTGFTICANPHVTFSATSEEKEEIERLLSMGVIL